MSSGYLSRDGNQLFYTVQGPDSGIPILLVHGWSCDITDWSFQLPCLLAADSPLRAIAFDLRGHGRSRISNEGARPAMDPATLAEDAASLLLHLGIGQANKTIVMGHSLGAVVATELAAAHPELVRGLVLIDPSYCAPASVFRQFGERFKSDFIGEGTAFLDSVYSSDTPDYIREWHKLRMWGLEPSVGIDAFEKLADCVEPSPVEYIQRKRQAIPRLIVSSGQWAVRVETEAGLAEYDRIEVIESGHWMMKVNPEAFNVILQDWLVAWKFRT